MRQSLLSLLALVSIAACTRRSAPSGPTNGSPGLVANQNASDTLSKTADGVAVCQGDTNLEELHRVGGDVLPPIATNAPDATLSDEAIKFIKEQHIQKFEAISIVALTVDAHGMPQSICLIKEAGHGLDRNALEVAARYRFKPATLNGEPVSVRITVSVRFANFPAGSSFGVG